MPENYLKRKIFFGFRIMENKKKCRQAPVDLLHPKM